MSAADGIEVIGGRSCCRADRVQEGMAVSVGFGFGIVAEIREGIPVDRGGTWMRRIAMKLRGDAMWFFWWDSEMVYLEPARHLRDFAPFTT